MQFLFCLTFKKLHTVLYYGLDWNIIMGMILNSIKFASKPVLMAFKLLNLKFIFILFY